MGKKTLIVDSDPQCNLTGICINSTKENKLEDLYKSDLSNIKSSIEPVFSGDPEPIKAANCVEFKGNDNLFLLPVKYSVLPKRRDSRIFGNRLIVHSTPCHITHI